MVQTPEARVQEQVSPSEFGSMSAKQMTQMWVTLRVLTGSESMPSQGRQAASLPLGKYYSRESSCVHLPVFQFHQDAR